MSRPLLWQILLALYCWLFFPHCVMASPDSPNAGNAAVQAHKILIVTSNQHTYGNTNLSAANHFEEIVIAYDVFRKHGYVVDVVSPQGGAIPLNYIDTANATQKAYLYDAQFMGLLKNTRQPRQIRASDYRAVYYSGGGSAMFGVADNKDIQDIATAIYRSGGVVSAICHGTAGIVNLKKADGSSLLTGRKITGFPDLFEDTDAEYYKAFPFSIDKEVGRQGGQFVYSKKWAANFYIADGNIITGQDPSATVSVAREVIKAVQRAI